MLNGMRARLNRFLGATLLFASVMAHAQIGPTTDDLWDVSNGNVVTDNSELLPNLSANDMFGAVTNTSPIPGDTLFTDSQLAGFVHSVEWKTPEPNTISGMVLNAGHDSPPFSANERGFSRFNLYAKNPNTNAFDNLLVQYDTANPYSSSPQPADGVAGFNQTGNDMALCVNFAPVTAQEFRAEFVQFGDSTPLARGPRIFELDGYAISPCNSFQITQGLNDAWFNPATNGQGFFIIVFEDIPLVFLAWFTYDTDRPPEDVMAILGDPGHRWITAQGGFEGNTAELDVVITRGGVFNAGEPAPENEIDGSMTVTFGSCTQGTISYDIPSLGLEGVVPIQRISNNNVALCEALSEG